MPSIFKRFRSGWNAFLGRDPTNQPVRDGEIYGYTFRPDRVRYSTSNIRNIVASRYNRISIDVASINFTHAKLNDDGQFSEVINSTLNKCLNLEANADQTGRALIQDIVQSMLDEGCVAVVPTDTDIDPTGESEAYNVLELRVGRITQWYPDKVKVDLYNERIGRRQEVMLPKSSVAIIENPFYETMNEPNSTLQRLIRTINKLDAINDQNASGKLDLLFQLPYTIRSQQRKAEADQRRKTLEDQLVGSKHGIGYIDAAERVIQLNRPIDNTIWEQVKELTTQLDNQLGLTTGVLDGTADESVMINYFNNTITPICRAICDEFNRKFLTKTARSQHQSIVFFRDPFKLVPVSQLADIADKFRRNEIMTTNEIRSEIGMKPSDAQEANTLRNPNLNQSKEQTKQDEQAGDGSTDDVLNEILGSQDSEVS